MLFYQAAAPTGWTQNTSLNDYSLRVVSGSGGGYTTGNGVSSLFSGSNTVGSTAITEAQMPSHTHGVNDPGHTHGVYSSNGGSGPTAIQWRPFGGIQDTTVSVSAVTGITIQYDGGGQGHSHTIPNLAYANVIICTKN